MLKEVDKRYRDYLWSNSEEQRKVTLVASEKVRKPKKFGGINIKGCGKWNEASLGKLLWQLNGKKNCYGCMNLYKTRWSHMGAYSTARHQLVSEEY